MAIVVLFYKVCFNTLDICLHWLLSRVLYGNSLEESNIEGPFEIECFQRHRRGFWSCWQIFPVVTARAVFSVPSNILGDLRYALVLGSSNVLPLIWRHIFRGIDCPKAPNFLVFFRSFRKDCSLTANGVLGSIIPAFCFLCLVMEKVSWALFPDI